MRSVRHKFVRDMHLLLPLSVAKHELKQIKAGDFSEPD